MVLASALRVGVNLIPMPTLQLNLQDQTKLNSMEQSPSWGGNRCSTSQEIPHILWNPEVQYRIHKSQPTVPILSQINPHPHPISWRPILSLCSHLRLCLPRGLLSSDIPTKPSMHLSFSHAFHMPRPSHSSRFDHPNNIWWGVQIIKLLVV